MHETNHAFDGVAFDPTVEKHLRLAMKMAAWCAKQGHHGKSREPDEWLGVAVEVLFKSVAAFDASKGVRFSTYYCRAMMVEYSRRDEFGGRSRQVKERVERVDDDGNTCVTHAKVWKRKDPRPIGDGIGWRGRVWRVHGPKTPLDELIEREDRERDGRRVAAYVDDIEDLRAYDLVRRGAAGVKYRVMAADHKLSRERSRQLIVGAIGVEATHALAKSKRYATGESHKTAAAEARRKWNAGQRSSATRRRDGDGNSGR